MSQPPTRLWLVSWIEHRATGDREQERKCRSVVRAAQQTAAILACPDDIAELKGVHLAEDLRWVEVDPVALVAELPAEPESEIDDEITPAEKFVRVRDAWRASSEGGRPVPVLPAAHPGTDTTPVPVSAARPPSPSTKEQQ